MNIKRVGIEFRPSYQWLLDQVIGTGIAFDDVIALEVGHAKLLGLFDEEMGPREYYHDPALLKLVSERYPALAREMRENESQMRKGDREQHEKTVAKVEAGGKVGALWGIDLIAVREDRATIVAREGGRAR